MNQGKKVALIAILAIMVSSFSLMVSYSVIVSVNDTKEVTPTTKDTTKIITPELVIEGIKDIKLGEELDKFTTQPAIVNNKVKYGLQLNDIYGEGSFSFNIVNKGEKEAVISEISIKGLEEYGNNVQIEIVGAKVGDKIPASFSINNIEVRTIYVEPLTDEEGLPIPINLSSLEIEFMYE